MLFFIRYFFIFSLILSFFSSIFVKNENNFVTKEIHILQKQVKNIISENEMLNMEIKKLKDHKRVASIAEEAGLKNRNNIVVIKT